MIVNWRWRFCIPGGIEWNIFSLGISSISYVYNVSPRYKVSIYLICTRADCNEILSNQSTSFKLNHHFGENRLKIKTRRARTICIARYLWLSFINQNAWELTLNTTSHTRSRVTCEVPEFRSDPRVLCIYKLYCICEIGNGDLDRRLHSYMDG